jgi:hypothetical protein
MHLILLVKCLSYLHVFKLLNWFYLHQLYVACKSIFFFKIANYPYVLNSLVKLFPLLIYISKEKDHFLLMILLNIPYG